MRQTPNRKKWIEAFREFGDVKKAAEVLGLERTGFYFHLRTNPDFKREILNIRRDKLAAQIEATA